MYNQLWIRAIQWESLSFYFLFPHFQKWFWKLCMMLSNSIIFRTASIHLMCVACVWTRIESSDPNRISACIWKHWNKSQNWFTMTYCCAWYIEHMQPCMTLKETSFVRTDALRKPQQNPMIWLTAISCIGVRKRRRKKRFFAPLSSELDANE